MGFLRFTPIRNLPDGAGRRAWSTHRFMSDVVCQRACPQGMNAAHDPFIFQHRDYYPLEEVNGPSPRRHGRYHNRGFVGRHQGERGMGSDSHTGQVHDINSKAQSACAQNPTAARPKAQSVQPPPRVVQQLLRRQLSSNPMTTCTAVLYRCMTVDCTHCVKPAGSERNKQKIEIRTR